MFILVALYVVFGDYLYFRWMIPTLNKAPGVLPSTQLKDIEAYLQLLRENGKRPWFIFYLENIKAITSLMLISMIPGLLHILGVV